MIPEDWEVKKVGDFVDIKHGYALKGEFFSDIPNENIVLTPGNFKIGGGFKSEKFKYTTEAYSDEYVLKEGDVIVTMTDLSKEGDTLGYAAKVPHDNVKKFLHNQRLGLLKFKSKISKDFLYWVLRSKRYNFFVVGSATGSTVKHTSPDRIKQYSFGMPISFYEQEQIAKVLSDLDSKIELNQQMNKNLEAIGQAIFKHWFIDFEFPNEEGKSYKSSDGEMVYNEDLGKDVPKGWEVSNIDKEFNLVMGQSPPGSSYNEIGEGVVFFQGRTDFGHRFPSIRMFCTEPNRFAKKGDTLISVRAPVGDINLALQDCCIGRGLAAIRHKSNASSYTYYFMMTLKPIFDQFEAEGTVFGSLGKTDFEKIKVLNPPTKIINSFQNIVELIDKKIEYNILQILTLHNIRDSLLPKLLSGKIRVPVEVR
jgi:type I restriction enzyme S subunit